MAGEDSDKPKRIPPSIPPKRDRQRPSMKDVRNPAQPAKPEAPKPAARRPAPRRSSNQPAADQAYSQYRSAQARRSAQESRPVRNQSQNSPDRRTSRSSQRPTQNGRPASADASRVMRQDPNRPSSGQQPKRVSWRDRESYSPDATRVQQQTPRRQPPPSYAPQSRRSSDRFSEGAAGSPGQPLRQAPPSRQPGPTRPQPGRPSAEPAYGRPAPAAPRRRRKRGKATTFLVIAVLLIALVGWPIGVLMWASGKIAHVDALSGAPDTPGTTYLLAGSDSREGTEILDDTEGRRADSIMLLHKAENGNTYMVSIPRDSWVNIPEYGEAKINASYAYGGEALLVKTVEELSGLTVDHFVEIGMYGVQDIVDSMGGVELCLDYDVDDPKSELVWKAGCHVADGHTALAFARMRYSDPNGDIGRAERQRQVIGSVVKTAASPKNFLNPLQQKSISGAAASAVTTDPDTSALELAKMAWYFKQATDAGLTGAPPISTIDLETYMGSAVELDPYKAPEFFTKLKDGNLQKEDFNQIAQ